MEKKEVAMMVLLKAFQVVGSKVELTVEKKEKQWAVLMVLFLVVLLVGQMA
jgi:hypothetical protein